MAEQRPEAEESARLLGAGSRDGIQERGGPGGPEQTVQERSEGRAGDALGASLVVAGVQTMLLTTWIKVFGAGFGALGAFMFHPTANVFAICLFAFGILTLQPTMHPRTKARGLARHQIVMLGLGIPALLFGSGAIVWYKVSHGYNHMYSWHAWLGLLAIVWLVFQVILGGGSVWFNGKLFAPDPKRLWKWHRASGYLLFLLFQVVIWLGVHHTTFFPKNTSVLTRIIVFNVAPAAVLFGLYSRARLSKMPLF
ncbi:hypothetical protein AURDEDRAFT_110947 [Auricularia subglabra TFB-10046 SS5]|nr:hypothetical protein AURDEDRAFT_110947 [Auricularia subglabra TFB-10046 SS5]